MGSPINKIELPKGSERVVPTANVPAPSTLVAVIQRVSETTVQTNDAHVVATAVIGKTAATVAYKIGDFSPVVISRYGVSKVRPDVFPPGHSRSRRKPMSPAK